MGNISANPSLRLSSSQFFFFTLIFLFFKANMNLTIFAGILLAITTATARGPSLGEKAMQAATKADEPDEAMRKAARPASLVEKIMRAAAEADEPDEANREAGDETDVEEFIGNDCDDDSDCCTDRMCTLNGCVVDKCA